MSFPDRIIIDKEGAKRLLEALNDSKAYVSNDTTEKYKKANDKKRIKRFLKKLKKRLK